MMEAKRRSLSRLLILTAVLTCLVTAVAALGAGGEDPMPDPDDPPADPVLYEAIHQLEPTALKRWPETFAGAWWDGQRGDVVIAFTAEAREKVEELTTDFPQPDLLRPAEADDSLRQLREQAQQIAADRPSGDARSGGLPGVSARGYDISIDVPSNVVAVLVEEHTPETQEAVRERYGADVRLEQQDLPEAVDCSRGDCRYDLRAGLKSVNANDVQCSTGFTVRRPDGTKKVLSAGHCTGLPRKHGGESYGDVVGDVQEGAVDAERIDPDPPFGTRPWIYREEGSRQYSVDDAGTYNELLIGDIICKAGSRTDRTCGTVLSKDYMPYWVVDSHSFVTASFCARGGDSGAPVFDQHTALGIVAGGYDAVPCSDWDDEFAVFGHIEFALEALNVTMVID